MPQIATVITNVAVVIANIASFRSCGTILSVHAVAVQFAPITINVTIIAADISPISPNIPTVVTQIAMIISEIVTPAIVCKCASSVP
jgi:hypothetical protein